MDEQTRKQKRVARLQRKKALQVLREPKTPTERKQHSLTKLKNGLIGGLTEYLSMFNSVADVIIRDYPEIAFFRIGEMAESLVEQLEDPQTEIIKIKTGLGEIKSCLPLSSEESASLPEIFEIPVSELGPYRDMVKSFAQNHLKIFLDEFRADYL